MTTTQSREISIDLIDRNPENPRIVFRPRELSQLTESIVKYGVQVPISVYRDGKRYVLIDGERRWRCSIKLNKSTIPALIQDKPDRLSNLLLMFNIHALREQWDLLTIALKLPDVIGLLRDRNSREPTEREISSETGLAQGVIRRCKLLMAIPEKYKRVILAELQKPKPAQKLTEDFFIEMERALTTVGRALPDVVNEVGKEKIREALIAKFNDGTIKNRVEFRQVAKISRAKRVSADQSVASIALKRLFTEHEYSIDQAYQASVASAYDERDVLTKINGLTGLLSDLDGSRLEQSVVDSLKELRKVVTALLRP